MPKNFFFELTYDKFKNINDYREAAVATLEYIATRKDLHGEKMNRTLFGSEQTYTLDEATQFVNNFEMKPLRLWRVIWSPALTEEINKKKDLDLRKIARKTMQLLRKIDPTIEFIVAAHNDHTEIPHVQGLVFVKGWISKGMIISMGKTALHEALEQRRSLDRGIDLVPLLQKVVEQQRQRSISASYRLHGMAGGKARQRRKGGFKCDECGKYHVQNDYCPKREKKRERELSL